VLFKALHHLPSDPCTYTGSISGEAMNTPGNIFPEAMRGPCDTHCPKPYCLRPTELARRKT
jgi:hypothetical protein